MLKKKPKRKLQKIKILILGADGFIGSNLIRSLLKEKIYYIRAFDLFKNGRSSNLEDIKNKIEIFSGDFFNRENLKKALIGVSYVFHLVSYVKPSFSLENLNTDIDKDIQGTIILLEECVNSNIKKIVFASSGGAIYGDSNKIICREEDNTNPISPYAISKLMIEKYIYYFKLNKGLDYLILRYSNLYGPWQNPQRDQGIINIFLNLIKKNKPIKVFGNGENIRDYLYITDAINITKYIFRKKTKYNIYNIGSGKGKSINKIIKVIEKITLKKVEINFMSERMIDIKRNILDTKRLSKEFDLIKKTSLEDGIRETWEWIIKNIK